MSKDVVGVQAELGDDGEPGEPVFGRPLNLAQGGNSPGKPFIARGIAGGRRARLARDGPWGTVDDEPVEMVIPDDVRLGYGGEVLRDERAGDESLNGVAPAREEGEDALDDLGRDVGGRRAVRRLPAASRSTRGLNTYLDLSGISHGGPELSASESSR